MTNPKSNSCNSKLVQGVGLASSTKQPLKHLKFQTTKSRKLKEGSPRKSLPSVQFHKILHPLRFLVFTYLSQQIFTETPSLNLPVLKLPNHPAPNPSGYSLRQSVVTWCEKQKKRTGDLLRFV